MLKIIMIFFISLSVHASKDQFLPFFDSLEDRFLMRTDHLIDISEKIRLKKIGFFGNRNAEAIYTPFTNTIALKKEYLVESGRKFRIKNYSEFALPNYNPFPVRASTIFHELAHADFDVIIEKDESHTLYKLLTSELPAWFKRHHSTHNNKTATHELFGYTAGDYIMAMHTKVEETLSNHGIIWSQNKCYPKVALEKIAKRLGLDKDLSFKDLFNNSNFKETVIPKVIFIDGKSINIEKMPDRFSRKLMNYFSKTYAFAKNSKELVENLNTSSHMEKLKECYKFLK